MTAAAQPRAVNTAQAIAQAGRAFEDYATRVSSLVGRRALAWNSIARQAAAMGMDPATVAPALAQMNNTATADAANWQTWVNDLAAGRAEMVPYQIGQESIKIAVRPRSGQMHGLGQVVIPTPIGPVPGPTFWPIIGSVVQLASRAALAAGTYFSFDAWNDTRQIEAGARNTDAQTRAALVGAAQDNPQLARELARATQRADAEAADAGPDWIDRLQGAATTAAAGIGGAALIVLAVIWWQSRKRGPKK